MQQHLIASLPRVDQPSNFSNVTLEAALTSIQTSKYKAEIESLRAIPIENTVIISNEKKSLPSYCFQGIFKDRLEKDNFIQSSDLFSFDIDKLPDCISAKEIIKIIPGVVFCFISPSGTGLKGAIHIKPGSVKNDGDFKKTFIYMEAYFKNYGFVIDKSCKDIRRLCFISHDPDIYINFNAVPIDINKPASDDSWIYINKIISMVRRSTAGTRHKARLDASYLAGGYIAGGTLDETVAYNAIIDASNAVSDSGCTSPTELKTILNAIEQGKTRPIFPHVYSDEIDNIQSEATFDLLTHIPRDHLLARMVRQISYETYLPSNSVFLMGLAVFSSIATRAFCTRYPNGHRLPIGLYAVAEQPSGSAKSRCLAAFQKPFHIISAKSINSLTADNNKPESFITNATAEGMESTLNSTKGFFSAVSSEQGLFNSLFGMNYNKSGQVNNNDLVLKGFNGEYFNSKRAVRKGYSGLVVGGVASFAQNGSIESVLQASGGTGLSERFLMLAEPHKLGTRDHTRPIVYDRELSLDYDRACQLFENPSIDPIPLSEIGELIIKPSGFQLINEYRNTIEPHVVDGGKFSHAALRGAAGKVDMQVMKIAANLHILSNFDTPILIMTIPDETVKRAIAIVNDLLNANLAICINKSLMGQNAEFDAIHRYLEKSARPRTELEIINSLKSTKPFSESSDSKAKLIRKALEDMLSTHRLCITLDQNGRRLINNA